MTHQFFIRPDGFSEIRKQFLTRAGVILIILLIACIGIAIPDMLSKTNEARIWPYYTVFIILVICFSFYRGINKHKAVFNSYTLLIKDHEITRQQLNTPSISIPINEIAEITQQSNGNFTIKGSGRQIHIPKQIDNYEEVEMLLSQIKAISINTSTSIQTKLTPVAALISMAAVIGVFTISNKTWMSICGIVSIIILAWSFYKIQGNKNTDNRTKRILIYIPLVLLSIILAMYFKLTQ